MQNIQESQKQIIIQMIFEEFNINQEDIKQLINIGDIYFIYYLIDEDGLNAILDVDFKQMKYTIKTTDYIEIKEIIVL